jgi:hypothetical protein
VCVCVRVRVLGWSKGWGCECVRVKEEERARAMERVAALTHARERHFRGRDPNSRSRWRPS